MFHLKFGAMDNEGISSFGEDVKPSVQYAEINTWTL